MMERRQFEDAQRVMPSDREIDAHIDAGLAAALIQRRMAGSADNGECWVGVSGPGVPGAIARLQARGWSAEDKLNGLVSIALPDMGERIAPLAEAIEALPAGDSQVREPDGSGPRGADMPRLVPDQLLDQVVNRVAALIPFASAEDLHTLADVLHDIDHMRAHRALIPTRIRMARAQTEQSTKRRAKKAKRKDR